MERREPTPLTPDEKARFLVTMSEWLARELLEKGSVRLAAVDTPGGQRDFQDVATHVSALLRRRVITVTSSHGMTFELPDEQLPDQERSAITP
ncbi:hypothetical protein FAF44_21370 [Nonomuraea sp. MG754425]|uniref:hypothetical protein n=1 Tax=Nonomuraea sp. MG754425 TaxID=2570319 RepID=UPI001F29F2F4|nr:hypothetical protein [Nonomuraea sp. MG754425]MCF6470926.1 hypothetical protein [Nonomuraea sp. MG754425]